MNKNDTNRIEVEENVKFSLDFEQLAKEYASQKKNHPMWKESTLQPDEYEVKLLKSDSCYIVKSKSIFFDIAPGGGE